MNAVSLPPICPACEGRKTFPVRTQRRGRTGGRFCTMDEMPCPVCQGTGEATQADLEAFVAKETTITQGRTRARPAS